ncbi:MAG: type I glyceraldehyde-3-phosphate dehydrogenase [Candidatus Paceibacterota bacterium]
MPIRVAINGAGRIGRAFFNMASKNEEVEIVAVNDLADIDNIAYLINRDSAYGKREREVSVKEDKGALIDGEREIRFFQEKNPEDLPWGDMDIDVVVEATGVFTKFKDAERHISAGAKRAVISAPAKDDPEENNATALLGINEEELKDAVVSSNASCTTNAVSPVVRILHDNLGIENALLNTVHAYTISQSTVDTFNKKNPRLGRAAAQNIVPTSTGAANATTKVITELDGRFDGIALRVPVVTGSIADITFIASRETSAEEVNEILKKGAGEDRWRGIFATTEEPIVSTDIIGSEYGSIADLSFTRVVGGNLVKVLAWYDNEMGYTAMLLRHVIITGNYARE